MKEDKLKVFTAFSGYDSQCLALNRLKERFPSQFDYELIGWSEIDENAIKAHNILFPQYADRNYGDISKVNWDEVPDFDLFTYSSPCFVAGTKVLVRDNSGDIIEKNIEDVAVDDYVITHKNRFRKVIRTMCHSYTGAMCNVLTSYKRVTCTENHPFFITTSSELNHPKWMPVGDMMNKTRVITPIEPCFPVLKDNYFAVCIDNNLNGKCKIQIEMTYDEFENEFFCDNKSEYLNDEYVMHLDMIEWMTMYETEDLIVYNLEVEEDNSYVANNFVVHNCTTISLAGKQEGLTEGSGTSSSLLWECRRCIETKKPKYLLFENVTAILSGKFFPEFEKWMSIVRNLGYVNFYKILNAKDYGVPQNRERIFMVSIRQDNGEYVSYNFPNPLPRTCRVEDLLEKEVSESYYVDQEKVNEWSVNNEVRITEYIAERNNLPKENLKISETKS